MSEMMESVSYKSRDVLLQDATSEIIDMYMVELENAFNPVLTASASVDEYSITVDDATGVLADGSHRANISENGRTYQGLVLSVVGNVITFDTPFDNNFTTDAAVHIARWNANVDGSVTPRRFIIKPPVGIVWDITRIIGFIEDDAEMDATKFGGIAALTKGVVLRARDGSRKNIFNVKDNGDFSKRSFDTKYDDRSSPLSRYGFSYRRTFAGQEKNGVVIRLNGDENQMLEFIVQDNLTGVNKFAHISQGHVVVL